MTDQEHSNRSILIVDDHKPIHDDFREVLIHQDESSSDLETLETGRAQLGQLSKVGMLKELPRICSRQ